MLSIDVSHAVSFLSLPYEAALRPRLERAAGWLQNGGGKGSDFIGWVTLPRDYDRGEYARILAAAKKIQGDSKALVVIGIGGSYLGARGVIECLCSPNYNLKKKSTPNIYFIGNGLSSDALREVTELIGDDDFSVNVISKSGTTTEPAVAFRFFREKLEQKYGKEGAAKRIYATTDAHKGALKSLADQEGYEEFVVPDNIGGRYSVLTAVGLLPIAVAGVDTDALLAGAHFLTGVEALMAELSAEEPCLLKFGLMQSGTVCNAISAETKVAGSLRVFSDEMFDRARAGVEQRLADACATYGCTYDLDFAEGYPPVTNDTALYDLAKSALGGTLELVPEPLLIAEDFAFYQRHLPGLFMLLGTGTGIPLHSDEFRMDEDVLVRGLETYRALLRCE